MSKNGLWKTSVIHIGLNCESCAINSRLKHHWTDRALNIKQFINAAYDRRAFNINLKTSVQSFTYTLWNTKLKPDQQKQTFKRQFYKSLYVQLGTANENAPNGDRLSDIISLSGQARRLETILIAHTHLCLLAFQFLLRFWHLIHYPNRSWVCSVRVVSRSLL